MNLKKIFWITVGFVSLGLGAVGTVLPMLPTVPFLLLCAFSFGKSSQRLHSWFVETKLYKNNLESYVKGEGMTRKTKVKIMLCVTILMTVGFVMMHQVPLGRIVLAGIWLAHVVYFGFVVKTVNRT